MQPAGVAADITAEEAVLRLTMALGRRLRTRIDGDSVDPSHISILYNLKCHGAMRLGDLAETMRLDASTVSRHVQQLGEHGFLDRVPDPEDGRARIIKISEAGRAALKQTFNQRRDVITSAITDWSDADREQLRDGIVRLTGALGEL